MSLAETKCRRCGEAAVFRALCALCLYQAGGDTDVKYGPTPGFERRLSASGQDD